MWPCQVDTITAHRQFLALMLVCNDPQGRVVIITLMATLTGFVLAVVLLVNVVPTRRLTRLDLLPAGRPDRIRVVCRYTSRIHAIGALHAIWVQHGRHEIDGRLHLDLTVDGVRRHVPSWAGLVAPDLADDLARRLAHSAVDVVVALSHHALCRSGHRNSAWIDAVANIRSSACQSG